VAEPDGVPQLMGGDLADVAQVPSGALRVAVVEHDLAEQDAVERHAVDRSRLARRIAIAADRQHAAAVHRIGDLVPRVVEDDAVHARASGVRRRVGESTVGQNEVRGGNAGPDVQSRVDGLSRRGGAELGVAGGIDEVADRQARVGLEPSRRAVCVQEGERRRLFALAGAPLRGALQCLEVDRPPQGSGVHEGPNRCPQAIEVDAFGGGVGFEAAGSRIEHGDAGAEIAGCGWCTGRRGDGELSQGHAGGAKRPVAPLLDEHQNLFPDRVLGAAEGPFAAIREMAAGLAQAEDTRRNRPRQDFVRGDEDVGYDASRGRIDGAPNPIDATDDDGA
jgi:hypothetical protein